MGRIVRVCMLAIVLYPVTVTGQTVRLTGTVRDERQPLARAQVEAVRDDAVAARTASDEQGRYSLLLAPGSYSIVFRMLGYAEQRVPQVLTATSSQSLDATLLPQPFELDHLAVTALRRTEKALDAPASITVIDEQTIRERTVAASMDYLLGLAGVDIAMQGLQGRQVVARGFNQTFGTSLLMLSDYRNAAVPSLRANLSHYITPASDDLERVEVLRGPASALYGQNAADGVVHFLTKSPFDSPGTTASLTGGTRSFLQGSVRHAAVFGDNFAFRVSGKYLRGDEWDASAQTSELAARDPVIERVNADARIDYRVTPTGMAILNFGTTHAMRHVEYTGIGASQVKDWKYHFAQLRFNDGRLFAQAYVNVNDAGQTFNLRTMEPVHDASQVMVAQVQHGVDLGRSLLLYGIDAQRTNPRTEGTISGRNESDDISLETGAYVQAETRLTSSLMLLTAARADRHNRIDGIQLSPRVALQLTPGDGQRWRVAYNRAFTTPTSTDMFLDLLAARLDPLPYGLRAVGVPRDGFQFSRACNGLCMTSPFSTGGPQPLDATALWPVVVTIMKANGADISAIPAPSRTDVKTVLRILDPSISAFQAFTGEPRDIDALEPTITNSLEFGYKGLLKQRLLLDVTAYVSRRENFRGPLAVETPNAFLSTADLAAYFGRFMPAANAGALAAGIGGVNGNPAAPGIPLATVSPTHALAGSDILLTYRNFGKVDLWGSDISAEFILSDHTSLTGAYSYTSDNYFPGEDGVADLALNAPQHRGALSMRYRGPQNRLTAELRTRHLGGFDMVDGVWTGSVASFNTIDTEIGTELPRVAGGRLVLTAQNLLNDRHAEFVGAPVIGRMLLARVQYRF